MRNLDKPKIEINPAVTTDGMVQPRNWWICGKWRTSSGILTIYSNQNEYKIHYIDCCKSRDAKKREYWRTVNWIKYNAILSMIKACTYTVGNEIIPMDVVREIFPEFPYRHGRSCKKLHDFKKEEEKLWRR